MITYIAFLITLLVTFILYKYIYKARKTFYWYADTMQQLGYKVYKVDWKPLGGQIVKKSKKDQLQYGDVNYFWKTQATKYDVILSNVLNQPLIMLVNPDLIKDFYEPDKIYMYQKHQKLNGAFIYYGGKGIVFDEGSSWKKKRKTLNNVFNFDFIKGMIPLIKKQIDLGLDQIETSQRFPKCYVYQELFAKTLGGITAKSFFGQEILSQKVNGIDISTAVADLIKKQSLVGRTFDIFILGILAFKLNYRKQYRQMKKSYKEYNQKVQKFINKKINEFRLLDKQVFPKRNVFSEILRLNQQAQNQQEKYTQQEIISEFNNLFLAGMETTSQLLTMMTYYMVLNPQVRKKAIEEINTYIKSEDDINYETLKKMKYLQGIQNETLRMYGPGIGIFVREATVNHKIKDVPIWKGTLLFTAVMSINYNEKYYKEPFTFKPQRWTEQNDKQRHPFVNLNFSAGPRSCLGKQLALIQSKIFAIKFLQRYGQDYKLQKNDFKMIVQFGYVPEKIDTILPQNKTKCSKQKMI